MNEWLWTMPRRATDTKNTKTRFNPGMWVEFGSVCGLVTSKSNHTSSVGGFKKF